MDTELLRKYLGSDSPDRDFRKNELLEDGIDIEQWAINVEYISKGPSPDKIFSLTTKEKELSESATSELILFLKNSHNWPPIIKIQHHFWLIAAYPDVYHYFYTKIAELLQTLIEKESNNSNKPNISNLQDLLASKPVSRRDPIDDPEYQKQLLMNVEELKEFREDFEKNYGDEEELLESIDVITMGEQFLLHMKRYYQSEYEDELKLVNIDD